jgi:hypothetical protein
MDGIMDGTGAGIIAATGDGIAVGIIAIGAGITGIGVVTGEWEKFRRDIRAGSRLAGLFFRS